MLARVLVQNPFSVVTAFTPSGRIAVPDSHVHGKKGPSIATFRFQLSIRAIAEYLWEHHGPFRDAHLCLLTIV